MTASEHPDIPEMKKQLKKARELVLDLLHEAKPHPLLVRWAIQAVVGC